ncbi:unnamed protein product [Notodromas monacha]|uniref:G-protein coupled receptors family 2 profile 2 domain-containing protein n=1 Tax=Notodromas monacha TaxID=399045 RepID=A0A7R9GGQ8_9CRUS|nr:unnamed protein product [Notodromas monacha]CAG0920470.1 unnamed protein product [Notodromas monacha]
MSCMDYDPSAISLYPVTNSADGTVAPDTIPDITPSVLPTFETHCSSVNPVARQAQEFHFLETGHLYFQHPTKVVSPDDFCLESALDFENNQTLAVVIVCEPSAERQRQKLLRKFDDQCEGQVCVLKCCPAGTSLMRMPNGHNTCAALPEGMSEWTPVFHDGTDFHEVIVEESAYKVIKGFSPICPDANAGVLAQLPSLVPEEAIYMMTTGNVYSKKYSRIIPAPEYCMDKFVLNATAHDITLICFPPQEKSDPMFAVYSACLIVSSVFLLLTLVISILLPDASRLGTWTLLCYVASLLVASLTLAGLQTFATAGGGFCVVVACVLYYSFLSAFMWLNVMSFDIWYTLRYGCCDEDRRTHSGISLWEEMFYPSKPGTNFLNEPLRSNTRNLPTTRSHMTLRFLKRCAYAFGAPAGMIIILLVFQLADGLPETFLTKSIDPAKRCWFKVRKELRLSDRARGRRKSEYPEFFVNNFTIDSSVDLFRKDLVLVSWRIYRDNAILFYFYGPIALLLLANMVFFGLTMHFLISHRRKTRNLNMEESAKKRFTLFIKLFVVMGVGWITEVISWKLGPEEIWYVTDIVNALTGILVFLVFICRRKTLEDLNKLIKERCLSRGNGGVGKSRSIAFTKSQETAKTRFSTQETSLTMANSSEGKVKTMGDEPSGVGADVADANFNGRRLSGSLRGDDADE